MLTTELEGICIDDAFPIVQMATFAFLEPSQTNIIPLLVNSTACRSGLVNFFMFVLIEHFN